MSSPTKKSIGINLSTFNVNGVLHIGASSGEYADYYHKLGVYQTIWFEKNINLYSVLYSNTMNYGMNQKIVTTEISKETNRDSNKKTFLDFWRDNASFIDIDTYDMLCVACKDNQLDIVQSFDFLLDNLRVIVFAKPSDFATEEQTEIFLKSKGFNLVAFNSLERLYLKQGIDF